MKIFGLTGGIGSGKTTVGALLAQAGVPVIDADVIARELREPGREATPLIEKAFGTTDRAELRRLLTEHPEKRKVLEGILHPLIRRESTRRFQALAGTHAFAIYEASLLIEAGRAGDMDGIILVTAPIDAKVARLRARNAWAEPEARRAIALQSSDEEKRPHCQWIVANDGTLDELAKKTSSLLEKLRIAAADGSS